MRGHFLGVAAFLALLAGSGVPGWAQRSTYVGQSGSIITTVAGLAGYARKGTVAGVTDGSSATDCTVGGGATAVLCTYNGSGWNAVAGGSSNSAMKPASSDGIQYASTSGNDSNDGLSWGTAKATVAAACEALGSNSTCASGGRGTVWIGAGVTGVPWPTSVGNYPILLIQLNSGATNGEIGGGELDFLNDVRVWGNYGGEFELTATAAAAGSNSPQTAPFWFSGSYWTGGAAAEDAWLFQLADAPGANPTSTLSLLHDFGSTGPSQLFVGLPNNSPYTATSSQNWSSPSLVLGGNAWNGSASVSDAWSIHNPLANGSEPPSFLTFTHNNSTNTAAYNYGLEVDGSGNGNYGLLRLRALAGQGYYTDLLDTYSAPQVFEIAQFDGSSETVELTVTRGAAVTATHCLQVNGTSGPTWCSGSAAPTGSCTSGSLYSNTGGSSGSTLYTCVSSAWLDVK